MNVTQYFRTDLFMKQCTQSLSIKRLNSIFLVKVCLNFVYEIACSFRIHQIQRSDEHRCVAHHVYPTMEILVLLWHGYMMKTRVVFAQELLHPSKMKSLSIISPIIANSTRRQETILKSKLPAIKNISHHFSVKPVTTIRLYRVHCYSY